VICFISQEQSSEVGIALRSSFNSWTPSLFLRSNISQLGQQSKAQENKKRSRGKEARDKQQPRNRNFEAIWGYETEKRHRCVMHELEMRHAVCRMVAKRTARNKRMEEKRRGNSKRKKSLLYKGMYVYVHVESRESRSR